ncbi:MAG TPA: TonB family protein [Acidobacteriota bacterium]
MKPGQRSLDDLPLRGEDTVLVGSDDLLSAPPDRAAGGVVRALLLMALGAAAALGALFLLQDRGPKPPALVLDASVQPEPVRELEPAHDRELARLRAELESERTRTRALESQRVEAVDAAARAATQLAELRIQTASQQSAGDQLEASRSRIEVLEQELAEERDQSRVAQRLLSSARGQLAELEQQLQQERRREPEPEPPRAAAPAPLELDRLRSELEQARAASRRSAGDLLDVEAELGRERAARIEAESELARARRAASARPSPAATAPSPAAARAPEPAPVVPPRLIQSPVVRYPSAARARQLEGEVLVRVLVAPSGQVLEAQIERSAAAGSIFDQAALQAARGCRFEPARQSGRPVQYWTRIPIRFRLR